MFDPNLGPLGPLLGVWEGEKGTDLAPSDKPATNRQLATSRYRERMTFEPTGRVDNHEQSHYGLRYATKAWRVGAADPFHEEVGYWLWDPHHKLVMRAFMPPRGMAILAGGHSDAAARSFTLEATVGSHTFGICSSPFLDEQFKTERYTVTVKMLDDDTLYYDSHVYLRLKGRSELFDHRDENTLHRVKS
jgi:hypothetical protein